MKRGGEQSGPELRVLAPSDRIRERLGGPEYAALFSAVRRRLEEAWPSPVHSVTLSGLDDRARTVLAELHGWRTTPAPGPVKVRVAKLDEALRASNVGVGLREVVEALGGPLVPRAPIRAAARDAKERIWSTAARHPAIERHPELRGWVADLREQGLLARASGELEEQAKLLEQALAVVDQLPGHHKLLSVLAAEATGDAHALDPGRPLASVVLRAAACLAGWSAAPGAAGPRRRLWAEVGILCDPLSADVLVLGLRARGGRLARHLGECADEGEPSRVTFRELARNELRVGVGTEISICENPGVVAAAADQIGARCAPLVCLEGIPSTAAIALIERLRENGARFRFHGDFDWGGIRIGNAIAAVAGAEPWRFCTSDYQEAVTALPDGVRLTGAATTASWDPSLRPIMMATGRAIYEEQVLATLLDDLRAL